RFRSNGTASSSVRSETALSKGIVLAVPVALEQRHLQEGEDKGERKAEQHLAADPGVGREVAPHHLVDGGEHEEEQRPTDRQLPPAFVGQAEGGAEDRLEQWPAEQQHASAQDDAEQAVHDGGL